MTTLSWVVGRGGLLGRHVETALREEGSAEVWRPPRPVAWHDPEHAAMELELELGRFLDRATRCIGSWRVLWCAGAGVVATPREALARETMLVTRFLAAVGERLADDPALARRGTLFFASSAGGVYAASTGVPPFDERSPVSALAPYGQEKLAQEMKFTHVAQTSGIDVLIGRISNLYGPGQKLSKPQGLISHVGRAALRREPIAIYVPLDTIRDYLFAADAGRMVTAAITRREALRHDGDSPMPTVKIFASEVDTTVASVLGAWRQALRRPLRVALASSPAARLQPRILSFRSRIWPDVRRQPTLLAVGIDAVRRDQLARLMSSGDR